ncbi:integrase catalytic domain-containing protein [Nephila pilipes]|uniref:Integrase catalytic domain-containing protein n=1 Tax=Nephila pilipes TaxID=299642 RepID=A0A8X6NTZ6_NEPPI|nr:integrase catalytic domain-containing protein [Nephila pilipes]
MDSDQQKYLKVLRKEGLEDKMQVFALKAITYGTSATFLAIRRLQQLTKDEMASKVLLDDFYLDNCLSGALDIDKFMALKKGLGELLLRGGMTLHERCSSTSREFEILQQMFLPPMRTVKTLGIMWNSCDISNSSSTTFTKRDALSQIVRLFDPFGLLDPVITNIFM